MRGLRTRSTVAALAVAALMLAAPSSALAVKTIGLSSGTFKFEIDAGKTTKGQVFVTNDGDEPVNVLVYSADQEVDERGAVDYQVPTRADITQLDRPSSWIGVTMPKDSKSLGNVPYVTLEPGDRVPVNFTVQVPSSAPPGDHNLLLFFEMFEQQQQADGAQTIVSGRIGSRITMRVKGEVVERLTVRPFEVPAFVIGSVSPFTVRVNNEGNVDQRVTVNASLRNRSGNDVTSLKPIDARLVFANESLEGTGSLVGGKMPIGPMTVAIEVVPVDDEGRALASGKNIITEERQVWFIPLALLVAVAFVLVLVIARVIWAFAVRSARRTEGARSASRKPGRRGRATRGVAAPADEDDESQPDAE